MSTPSSTSEDVESQHFDSYAERYQEVINTTLAMTGGTTKEFTRYRMAYLRHRLPLLPKQVMDFGCGIGLAIPELLEAFPGSDVVGVDVSMESLKVAREQLGDSATICLGSELDRHDFDLAYCNGVFHHIPPDERPREARFVFDALRPGGVFALSENNPLNPVTHHLMRTCPFDEGAQMLHMKEACGLLRGAGFEIIRRDYVLFFPGPLKALRGVERWLGWCPFGTQYIVLARKRQRATD
jgi:SAM-dependent methyltransferase